MLRNYSMGAFPMAEESGEINWYYPQVRAIIPLDNYRITRSLRQVIGKNIFEIKFNTSTLEVIHECAKRKKTWISQELIDAYERIFKLGYVHSVETYFEKKLVGGLYGIAIRGAFFGESMFSKKEEASKVALYFLIRHLIEKNFKLLDVQFITPHLKMFGAVEISLEEYNRLLDDAYQDKC
ncbi:MAG: leucyl/phenylalanyl-tRNA--protein transferase [Ignavibacteria bacterium]|nr:leucyl/phenylalanyl-tRNA--protein transferase [Ignavibacteria bacterium]